MKNLHLAVLIILLFVLQVSNVFAQSNKLETAKRVEQTNKLVKPIDAYVKTIEDFVEKEGKPHLIITDVSDYNKDGNSIWKTFDSQKDFEKSNAESYTTAFIWKKDGKVIATNLTYSSPSGDWVQYVYYVFYEDGYVAKSNRELRTFMGDIIVNRINTYDKNGALLKESTNYRDLKTQKPVKATTNFQDIDVEIYNEFRDFPFEPIVDLEINNGDKLSIDEQKFIPKGWSFKAKDSGDLNGDKIVDSVLQVSQNEPEADDYDRIMIILFGTKTGKHTKIVESKKIIRCSSCGGMLGGGMADIEIKKGILIVEQMYGSRGGANYLHRFRYEPKSKRFRLIGEDVNNFDRIELSSETISTNYLTGRQIITKSKGGEKDVTETVKRKRIPKRKIYFEDVNYENY